MFCGNSFLKIVPTGPPEVSSGIPSEISAGIIAYFSPSIFSETFTSLTQKYWKNSFEEFVTDFSTKSLEDCLKESSGVTFGDSKKKLVDGFPERKFQKQN